MRRTAEPRGEGELSFLCNCRFDCREVELECGLTVALFLLSGFSRGVGFLGEEAAD